MYFSKNDISKLDKTSRIKTINSVSGIKPANLIGTADQQGNTNVAIFSSVVHLGSDPALLGFICRPRTAEAGHTYENIIETGNYTINHIPPKYLKNAHYTSAKLPKNVSEFNRCGFTEEYLNEFTAPFVKESHFKIGLEFREAMDIPLNGTTLIIGEIEHLIIGKQDPNPTPLP